MIYKMERGENGHKAANDLFDLFVFAIVII